MNKVYLLLGGNIGDRLNNLSKAHFLIEKKIGRIISRSSVYETAPWGFETRYGKSGNGNMFLNQAVRVETGQYPGEVLSEILKIELMIGRNRKVHQGAGRVEQKSRFFSERTIDIDILLYNDIVMEEDNLIIPHRHLHNRRFALIPLAEIASEAVHPKLKKTINVILDECEDELDVRSIIPAGGQEDV